jgi:hypothetical protein
MVPSSRHVEVIYHDSSSTVTLLGPAKAHRECPGTKIQSHAHTAANRLPPWLSPGETLRARRLRKYSKLQCTRHSAHRREERASMRIIIESPEFDVDGPSAAIGERSNKSRLGTDQASLAHS